MPNEFKVKYQKNAKGEQLYHCPFPDCGRRFAKEEGQPEVCLKHRQLIQDVIFIVNRLQINKPEGNPSEGQVPQPINTGPTIIVPKPGMSDTAIQEILKQSKGGN